MSSIFDFNDKDRIEKQIMLQLQLQRARRESGMTSGDKSLLEGTIPVPIRPSVYFGALQIDRLNEWEEADPKLT